MNLKFHFVPETVADFFLQLFPHRYDYIWAEHPKNQPPDWKTENRHPLSDRLINQGAYLYGVRFGPTTQYALIDIDRNSIYHPLHDRLAIGRILQALEPIGLVSYIACTSSYSGGIHLYFPFEEQQSSWKIGTAITALLENEGFQIEAGQLEVFPNSRSYEPEHITLYKGHRLPLQAGSYLLNSDWNLTYSTPDQFAREWRWCVGRNDLNTKSLEQVLKQAKRRQYNLSHRGRKFLADLDADIEPGWTGFGQTNFILGRIALRGYIFGELLTGDRLVGDRLEDYIISTAIQLPGYQDWCQHQHEIRHRAEEWARCAENSRYFPYGKKSSQEEERPESSTCFTWQQWESDQARQRIAAAIADLLEKGTLPVGARARFEVLTKHGRIGGATLYKHRDLWHPEFLWNSPPDPPTHKEAGTGGSSEPDPPAHQPTNLLSETSGNTPLDKDQSSFVTSNSERTSRNILSSKPFSQFDSKSLDTGQDQRHPATPPE